MHEVGEEIQRVCSAGLDWLHLEGFALFSISLVSRIDFYPGNE